MKYYPQSDQILQEIKKANSILLNAHRNPDLDSIGSSTVMYKVLKDMGKKVKIVCTHQVPKEFFFIRNASQIEKIDFKSYDFKSYDLFIVLDSGSYDIVTGSKEVLLPKMEKIVIDHHRSNLFTDVNIRLFEERASATCEMVYKLLSDWNINIDQDMATALFSGIAGDTVFLRYTENTKETYRIIGDLIEKGADKNLLVEKMFNNYQFLSVKLVGEFLRNMTREENFVWSAVDYETFEKYGKPKGIRELTADLFFQSVNGAKFGLALLEEEKGKIFMSFRSIKDTDVSKIARTVGGGGHKNAAGGKMNGEFRKIVKEIVDKVSRLPAVYFSAKSI
ncbi:bifunctional oligoribonuclease/PAP phosphatase NrnA [Candidatus Roizmanbacteria bacterium]|nr:bifunctional oligoribonuclease/PAP phosphatase NrnA [Candidatus Roizmanbacteria bacterium]